MADLDGKKILLLSSGGPDSATVARLVQESGAANVSALYLRSGNAADEQEILRAKEICERLGISLKVVDISEAVSALGGGALMRHAGNRLIEFGPAIMHSIALAYAVKIHADIVALGLHADDSEAGPQYSAEYIEQLNSLARLHGVNAPQVIAPLLNLHKHEVFALADSLGVDLSATWSCVNGGRRQCGVCPACEARREAFATSGVEDRTDYISAPAGRLTVS